MQHETTRRLRRTTAGAVLSTAVLLAPLFGAAPAAAVPGLDRVNSVGPRNSDAKSRTAFCSPGDVVLGGGGRIGGAVPEQVGMDFMLPLADGNGFSVTGREDETGTNETWSVTATALCAPAPAGYEVVSGISAPASVDENWHTVPCPFGKVALGAGGAVIGANNSEILLEDLRIDTGSVTVAGAEDGTGFAGNWQIQATAICADQPAGYERRLNDSGYDSVSSKSVTVTCSPGRQVHGIGAEILGGNGEVRLTAAHAPDTTSVIASAVEDEDGFGGSWKVRAFAICAN
ncbi:hypothetical protein [Polymorphospora rubra]|uniref:Uncharacterized protein n=1 Tax=Polymorphospora rubra TaxID=338584 RepID=A0A810NBG4_9ACTN|nr:hypothetical protein [Polymorphospora rubra]BCJ68675.1 hypothetical protein Prubr_56960 [Polymorphospora rubra]